MPSKKILVIDDNKTICFSFQEELQREGFDADFAFDSDEIAKKVKSNKYDLVILDIVMPESNAMLITKAIKKYSPNTKIIYMSGCIEKEEVLNDYGLISTNENSFKFLSKPLKEGELVGSVKSELKDE